jgi:hypothetical protein
MVQKDAFCYGTDPSILDNRSVRGGSRDPLKSIKNLIKPLLYADPDLGFAMNADPDPCFL